MIEAMVPGSIMIAGEHAVLHGKTAIVAAINQYITVRLVPRHDHNIHIISDRFGAYQTALPITTLEKPFDFVLAAIQRYQSACTQGFDLSVDSDIDPQYGLGSSAAVTVATLYCLAQFTQQPLSKPACHQQAHKVIQQLQGQGSGADAAASCFGGVLAYRLQPYQYIPLAQIPDIRLFYAGYKTPTAVVIQQVQQAQQRFPSLYQALYTAMDDCCQHMVVAWQQADWQTVADLMRVHQHLQAALGTSDAHLHSMITGLQAMEGIWAAKISGSGLGDCVLSIGKPVDEQAVVALMQTLPGVRALEVEVIENELSGRGLG